MAENVSWLLDQASPSAKIVVWAHNAHAGVDSTWGDSMGTYLRKQYGDAMVNFGFLFYSGSFNAFTMTGSGQFGALAVHQVVPPPENSYEYYFHSIGQPRFILNVRGIRPGSAATDWLLGARLIRSIGAGYTEASPETFFQQVALSRMFDVIVYLENTSPSHLLFPQSAMSMPQTPTYPSQPSNLGFEDGTSHWNLVGDRLEDYQIGTDGSMVHSGAASGHIQSTAGKAAGLGVLLQTFAAAQYRGQRLRMSAYVKTDSVSKGAGVLMRVDGANRMLAISNMQDRPVKGTTDWTKYDVVLDIPEDSVDIAFGPWIQETGRISFDDFQFEVVGSDVPITP
jgi:hypothetical protein